MQTGRCRLELSMCEQLIPSISKFLLANFSSSIPWAHLDFQLPLEVPLSQRWLHTHSSCSSQIHPQLHHYSSEMLLVFPLLPSPHSSCSTGSHINGKASTFDHSDCTLPFSPLRKQALCSVKALAPSYGWNCVLQDDMWMS